MQYLVSVEDMDYHGWQLELLIESFKLHGLEKELVIAIAHNDSQKLDRFTKNIRNHKRVFHHENYGRQRNYLPLNKIYATHIARTQNIIKEPFCLLEPDMVLVNPMPEQQEQIGFQIKWLFSLEYVEENGVHVKKDIARLLQERKLPEQELWLPLGNVYTFNDTPDDLFMRVINWTERLEYERLRNAGNMSWWHTGKVGWAMGMLDYYGMITLQGHSEYETTLIDNDIKHNFIHYNNGLPPVWSKYMYKYEPPDMLCMGGETPFEVLLSHVQATTAMNYLQQVITHYLGRK